MTTDPLFDAFKYITDRIAVERRAVKDVCDGILGWSDLMDDRRRAALLAWYIDMGNAAEPSDIKRIDFDDRAFSLDKREYLVLHEKEVDSFYAEIVRELLYTISTDYIAKQTGADKETLDELSEEDDNEAIAAIIDKSCGLDDFIKTVVKTFHMENFLEPTYTEYYYNRFYIFKINQ